MVTPSILLSFLFASGVMACCSNPSLQIINPPHEMVALSGSCLQIPCRFEATPPQEVQGQAPASGQWIKTDHDFKTYPDNVIFNSDEKNQRYPMNITGDLRKNNCTTLFSRLLTNYSDIYYFRFVTMSFKATACCSPLKIVVNDSPPSPKIRISKSNLQEKDSINVSCQAYTPCPQSPPQLTLNLPQDSNKINNIEEDARGFFTTTIQETITLSDQHDGSTIACSAGYPVSGGRRTGTDSMTISVAYAPKNTSVSMSPPPPVSAGTLVNLTCSSRANPAVSRFTWFKAGEHGAVNVSESEEPFYSFNATHGGVYHCVATNSLGKHKSRQIHLNVEGTDRSSPLPLGAVVGGIIGIVVLLCMVVALWWLKSKHPTSQQTQSLTAQEPADQEPAKATDNEDIRYGEINFTRWKPAPSSASAQDSGQPQDMLYAQVTTAKGLTKSAESPESIYAQVKTK